MTKAATLFAAVLCFALSPLLFDPFRGWEPSQFPVFVDRHPVQPAGYAFSLWGVIYLWLVLHGAFGLWKRAEDAVWDAPRTALTLAAALGTVWMPIAHMSPGWGVVTIWPMALAAIAAFLRADPSRDRWLLSTPLALLAGWMTAASGAATGVLLGGYGVLDPVPAALAMLGLVLLIAILVQRRQPGQPVYGLAVIWALAGILVANLGGPPVVALAAGAGVAAMAALLLMPLCNRRI